MTIVHLLPANTEAIGLTPDGKVEAGVTILRDPLTGQLFDVLSVWDGNAPKTGVPAPVTDQPSGRIASPRPGSFYWKKGKPA